MDRRFRSVRSEHLAYHDWLPLISSAARQGPPGRNPSVTFHSPQHSIPLLRIPHPTSAIRQYCATSRHRGHPAIPPRSARHRPSPGRAAHPVPRQKSGPSRIAHPRCRHGLPAGHDQVLEEIILLRHGYVNRNPGVWLFVPGILRHRTTSGKPPGPCWRNLWSGMAGTMPDHRSRGCFVSSPGSQLALPVVITEDRRPGRHPENRYKSLRLQLFHVRRSCRPG
jgi:hypothetical protein